MHNSSSVKSNLVDTSRKNVAPICPKPRRLGSALPAQFLNHPAGSICYKHPQLINGDARSTGILNLLGEKRKEEEGELCGCSRCSLSASPPRRTDNPLIRDVHFLQIRRHIEFFPPT